MSATLEKSVYDVKTNFSAYARQLHDGEVAEIVVTNRNAPYVRIVPFVEPGKRGIRLGVSKDKGRALVDMDAFFEMDEDVAADFDLGDIAPLPGGGA